MTRRKRKDISEDGGANENSPSVSADKDSQRVRIENKAKTSNVNVDTKKSTRRTTSYSHQKESDRNIEYSDVNDNTDRVGLRRSMRRPASTSDDVPTSAPPPKKVRKTIELTSKNTSSNSEIQDDLQSDPELSNEVDVESTESSARENYRRESKNDRNRKRKLADINEDSTFSETGSPNNNKTDKSPKSRKSESESDSEMSEGKRSVKGLKRRRKVTDSRSRNGKKLSEEASSVSESQNKDDHEDDDKYCHCPVPGYPKASSPIDPSEFDEDWKNWNENENDITGDLLCNRSWRWSSSKKAADNDPFFTVLTYNILAESLLKTSHYFKRISPSHWNQKNRHKLLIKELTALNADVLCLQEVEDGYQPELSNDMSSLGYNGFYACSESSGRTEGVAIYYRTSRFTEVARKSVPFAKIADSLIDELNVSEDHRTIIREYTCEPQMLQCIILKCQNTGKEICIGNAHISYAKHQKPDLRCVQVAQSIDQIMSFSSSNLEATHPMPFVFCGDFNSIPASAAYQLCRDGYLNDKMLNYLQESQNISVPNEKNKALVNILWKAFQHSAHDLQSCYYDVLNREPPMTLNLEGNSGCVDYLWYTKTNLSVNAVLIPRSSIIKRLTDSIPNAVFPSDHLSLCARLSFK